MLMEASEDMRIAGEKLLELSADQEAQAIAEARRLAIWERNDIIVSTDKLARKEERKIADIRVNEEREKADTRVNEEREKAEAEKAELLKKADDDKIANAKNMIEDNFSVEMIERYTGLSAERIKQLQDS